MFQKANNSNSSRQDIHPDNSHSNREIALTKAQEDSIVETCSDLLSPNYRVWAIKKLKKIGPQSFLAAADKARKEGKDPRKYFAYLIGE